MKHILSVDQFSIEDLIELLKGAAFCANGCYSKKTMDGKILTNLFYETSTRTASSFHSAMLRLGGSVIPINDVKNTSVSKGETLEDTIRTLQSYSDIIVIRHNVEGAALHASQVATVPIINGGDGVGEHPTQALLDLMTILIERIPQSSQPRIPFHLGGLINDGLSGLTITMMGDLKHGRTVKSLAKLLKKFDIAKIIWVAPDELQIPSEFVGNSDIVTSDLGSVIKETDVLYVTRLQKERINGSSNFYWCVSPAHMAVAKDNMILMHPLPRNNEIPTSLDSDPRSAYFRQMKYGLFMRMSVLDWVLR